MRISQYEGYEIKSEVSSPLYFIRSEHHHIVGPIPKFYTKPDLVWLADLIFLLNEGLIEALNQEQSTPIDCFLKEKWNEVSSELYIGSIAALLQGEVRPTLMNSKV